MVVPAFMHHNKLTIKVVSKLLLGLTILSQALIHTPNTPIPNLMGVEYVLCGLFFFSHHYLLID